MNELLWRERWSFDELAGILRSQFEGFLTKALGIEREQLALVRKAAATPHVVIVSGLRRAGKSTLMAQHARTLPNDSYYFVNFDDDRFLHFAAADASALLATLIEVFGPRKTIFLDEVQNVPEWGRFVRRWMDEGYKVYLTGSNAALLSRELGTRLTGRHLTINLFPFSFSEFVSWRKLDRSQLLGTTPELRSQRNRVLLDYLEQGGIPEALRYPDLGVLRTLYDDVIHRDIVTRHKIVDSRALRDLAFRLMSNPAGLVSFSHLKQQIGVGSINTIKAHVQHLEDSWLILTSHLHDASIKRQQLAPKKIHGIDTGLMRAVGARFSPDTGHFLENMVHIALRRAGYIPYYAVTQDNHEVDNYVRELGLYIQVAQQLSSTAVRNRELRALHEATAAQKGSRALLLTLDPSTGDRDGAIEIIDLARWMLAPTW